jgi:large subunit ribosomal protein L35
MPKMKTRKSLVGRFRLTASGELLRNRPGRRHKLTKKSSKAKRQMRHAELVAPSHRNVYRREMGLRGYRID